MNDFKLIKFADKGDGVLIKYQTESNGDLVYRTLECSPKNEKLRNRLAKVRLGIMPFVLNVCNRVSYESLCRYLGGEPPENFDMHAYDKSKFSSYDDYFMDKATLIHLEEVAFDDKEAVKFTVREPAIYSNKHSVATKTPLISICDSASDKVLTYPYWVQLREAYNAFEETCKAIVLHYEAVRLSERPQLSILEDENLYSFGKEIEKALSGNGVSVGVEITKAM